MYILFWIIILFLFIKGQKNNGYDSFKQVFILALFFILCASFREPYGDCIGYQYKFYRYSYYSFSEIIIELLSSRKSPIYYFVGWLFSCVCLNFQIWLSVIALIFIVSVSILIYKYSTNVIISFVMFYVLGFFIFSLTGLRQAFSMAFAIISFLFLEKNKTVYYFIFIFIGILFHLSAIIFILPFLIKKIKLNIYYVILIFICAFFVFVFKKDFFRLILSRLLVNTYLSGYAERERFLNFSGFIIQGTLFLFFIRLYKETKEKYVDIDIFYWMSFIGLCFQLFSTLIAEFFRLSMYFSIFNIILMTKVLDSVKNQELKQKLTTVVISILFLYSLRNGIPQFDFLNNILFF